MATAKEQRITITASSGLSKDEVQNMVREAEGNADEDKKRKELIETRNQLDSLVYSTEKLVAENKAKLSEADIKHVEDAAAAAKKTLQEKENDLDALKDALKDITQASHRLAEAMYKGTAPHGAPEAGAKGPEAGPAQGEVVDAEVVDDKK